MQVEQSDSGEPNSEELRDLEKLKAIIEQAVADGKITRDELAAIKATAWADGKITPQELELYSTLVLEKIRSGELTWEFEG
jgi:uncharacterized membrane protein YebE (DUF533 family)